MMDATSISLVGKKERWIAVSALFLAAFISLLDITVVNLALPRIAQSLGATDAQSQWVLLAYLVPFAAALLPFGRFGDVLGRRRLFLFGVYGFAAGALAAGTAQTIVILLGARILQGFAAAAMMPQVLALTHVIMPPDVRPRAIGYFGMVTALGAVAGPVVGGVVLAADIAGLGWRMVFLMSAPVCFVSATIVAVYLPKEPIRSLKSLDIRNSVLFGVAVALLVYPMVQGRSLGWPLWIVAFFPVAGLLAAHVINDQLHTKDAGRVPLLPQALLRMPSFLFGLMVMLLLFSGIAGVPFLLALDLQNGPNLSPPDVAIALVMHPVGAAVAAYLAGRINPANEWIKPAVGVGLTLIGIVLVRYTMVQKGVDISPFDLMIPLTFVGLGMGATAVSLFQSLLSKTPQNMAGAAAGMLQTAQQIGITISIATVGAVYFNGISDGSTKSAAGAAFWIPISLFTILTGLCILAARTKQKDLHQ